MIVLIGGWPGGWIAQIHCHHKTRKPKFRILFFITVLLHAGFIIILPSHTECEGR